MKAYLKETLCFGLDIGTRTVVGIVGYKEGEQFILVDYECKAHEARAMLDGQIHDIQKVSHVVYEIKSALEKRLGITLKEVAIAAAGRSLSTQVVEVIQNFDEIHEITLSDIHHLELEGVEKAKLAQQEASYGTDYYCVAYSVVQYFLEDYVIANLEGHKGQQIKAKLIATFLPKQVIDSLYAVTERADLTVCHLTLEPIAAINAIIPKQIRLLNLALIDIGAGTSDIAITKEGSITSYGMIPNAGDEVTEAIVHKYLVDFNTAEKIKIQATMQNQITFSDIIGLSHEISTAELKEVIMPVIESIACQIAQRILSLNGGNAPNAVFCVGGGSQMLEITNRLSHHLGLPLERVALRSTAHLINVKDEIGIIDSPEMITPLGICMTMLQDKYNEFTFVKVNEQKVQLLNAKKLTILDAIIALGIEHHAIFPQRGNTLMFKVNGERRRIKGENGSPATILLNGSEASIQDHIQDGDCITVKLAQNGDTPRLCIEQIIKCEKSIYLEGIAYKLPLVKVNGQFVGREYMIMSNDEITSLNINSLKDLFDILNLSMDNKIVYKNSHPLQADYILQPNDDLKVEIIATADYVNEKVDNNYPVAELAAHPDPNATQDPVQDEEIELKRNLYIMVNNQMVCLPFKDTDYIFANIFDYIDFDLSTPQGTIQLTKNGNPGALTDNIHNGDVLEIYWNK